MKSVVHRDSRRFNWRAGIISPYESVWCITQKYAVLNRVAYQEAASSLCTPSASPSGSQGAIQEAVGRTRLLRRLGLQSIPGVALPLSRLLPPGLRGRLGASRLRACVQCLEQGFHSCLHQLPWVSLCVFHPGTPLTEHCPACLMPWRCTSGSWGHDAELRSLRCPCGRSLLPDEDRWNVQRRQQDDRESVGTAHLEWLRDVCSSLRHEDRLVPGSHLLSRNDVAEYMSRLARLCRPSPLWSLAWTSDNWRIRSVNLQAPADTAMRIQSAYALKGSNDLLDAYLAWSAMTGAIMPWTARLERLARAWGKWDAKRAAYHHGLEGYLAWLAFVHPSRETCVLHRLSQRSAILRSSRYRKTAQWFAIEMADYLWEHGLLVSPASYPKAPSTRIRITSIRSYNYTRQPFLDGYVFDPVLLRLLRFNADIDLSVDAMSLWASTTSAGVGPRHYFYEPPRIYVGQWHDGRVPVTVSVVGKVHLPRCEVTDRGSKLNCADGTKAEMPWSVTS